MTEREALKPCPFCGGKVGVSTGQWGEEGTRDWLECRGCGAQQQPYDDNDPDGWAKMIAAWNQRATPAPVAAGEGMVHCANNLPAFDAGLLGDGGGGDVSWWQDYIRSLLEQADQHYREHVAAAQSPVSEGAEIERLRSALEPFAREAENYDFGDGSGPDLHGSPDASSLNEINDLLVGDLRRAKEALDSLQSPVAAVSDPRRCDIDELTDEQWEAIKALHPKPEGLTPLSEPGWPDLATPAPDQGEVERLNVPMLGRFVMQYEEGAAGFFVDADDAQEVAQQVKAALALPAILSVAIMAEIERDQTISTEVCCKIYAALKRVAALRPDTDTGKDATK